MQEDLHLPATTAAVRSHLSGSTNLLVSPSSDDTKTALLSTVHWQNRGIIGFTAELSLTKPFHVILKALLPLFVMVSSPRGILVVK